MLGMISFYRSISLNCPLCDEPAMRMACPIGSQALGVRRQASGISQSALRLLGESIQKVYELVTMPKTMTGQDETGIGDGTEQVTGYDFRAASDPEELVQCSVLVRTVENKIEYLNI